MRKTYIKPTTHIVSQLTEAVFMAGSDDGNPYGAKPQTPGSDLWDESSDDNGENPWSNKTNLWDE